jgi:hypothetical protein
VIECRCGAVAVALSGPSLAHFFCHCDDCQAAHCGAFVPVAMYRADAVEILRGELGSWKLRTTARRTCLRCGTRVFAEPNERLRGVSAYLLPPGQFVPKFHIYCRFALVPVADALPHYADVPARFGGSDEQVAW